MNTNHFKLLNFGVICHYPKGTSGDVIMHQIIATGLTPVALKKEMLTWKMIGNQATKFSKYPPKASCISEVYPEYKCKMVQAFKYKKNMHAIDYIAEGRSRRQLGTQQRQETPKFSA